MPFKPTENKVTSSFRARLLAAVFLGLLTTFWSLPVRGQEVVDDAASQTLREEEENKRLMLEEAPSRVVTAKDLMSLETGGWYYVRYSDYNNSDNNDAAEDALDSRIWNDVRVWGRLSFQTPEMKNSGRKHRAYLRLKNVYIEKSGSNPVERYDNRGPSIDQGYLAFDWDPVKLEAGRRYFNVGRGIAYSGVHDGVQLNFQRPGWNLGAFVSTNQPGDTNLDTSVPGYDKTTRRYFTGLGLGYAGIRGHQLYSYAVLERDGSEEDPDDPDQDYTYDANYFGLGSKGAWTPSLPYWFEVIRQTGQSRTYGENTRGRISAWALDAEQRYETSWPTRLAVSAEYAMGTGDPDRQNPTNTIGGNLRGHDRNFLYFGYLPTGIALSPYLSNLRIVRLGAEAKPFVHFKPLQKMQLGVDYFWYWKDRSSGGISDYDAATAERKVGEELDLKLEWRFTSRTILSAEYGRFRPDKAFPPARRTSEETTAVSFTVIF